MERSIQNKYGDLYLAAIQPIHRIVPGKFKPFFDASGDPVPETVETFTFHFFCKDNQYRIDIHNMPSRDEGPAWDKARRFFDRHEAQIKAQLAKRKGVK